MKFLKKLLILTCFAALSASNSRCTDITSNLVTMFNESDTRYELYWAILNGIDLQPITAPLKKLISKPSSKITISAAVIGTGIYAYNNSDKVFNLLSKSSYFNYGYELGTILKATLSPHSADQESESDSDSDSEEQQNNENNNNNQLDLPQERGKHPVESII